MIEARLDPFINACRYCDATIVWADGPGSERIPFDADPVAVHEDGNWALNVHQPPYLNDMRPPDKVLKASQPTRGQAAGMRAAGIRLYNHHALTCPQSDKWHKVKEYGKASRRARSGRR